MGIGKVTDVATTQLKLAADKIESGKLKALKGKPSGAKAMGINPLILDKDTFVALTAGVRVGPPMDQLERLDMIVRMTAQGHRPTYYDAGALERAIVEPTVSAT